MGRVLCHASQTRMFFPLRWRPLTAATFFFRAMMATSTGMTCSLYTLKQAGRVRRAAPQPDELRVGLRYR